MKSNYTKLKGVSSQGGYVITDEEGIGAVLGDVLKQLGIKLLEGNFVDIMKISRPARISSPLTQLNCFANDLKYTDYLLKASKQSDPVDRLKYVCTFLIAGLHYNFVFCKSKAPLNPILGETLQAFQDNGCEVYCEQTSHHPPIHNFLLKSANSEFEMFGFCETNAAISGLNSLKGTRPGKNLIRFKDGLMLTYTVPEIRINNLIVGERSMNFFGQLVIKDHKNKLECTVDFPYKDMGSIESLGNKISNMWKTNDAVPFDEFVVSITKTDKKTKEKSVVCEGQGSVFGQLFIDGKKMWSIENGGLEWKQEKQTFYLKSDSQKREDLKKILEGDFQEAQKKKEELENLQRKDKNLRKNNQK